MVITDELVQRLSRMAKNDSYLSLSLEDLMHKIEGVNSESIAKSLDTLAHYHRRANEFGSAKWYRYGGAMIEIARETTGLCLAYRLSQDSKYIEAAKSMLIAVCHAPDWVFQGKIDNHFEADLLTADIGVNVAIAFSSLSGFLSKDEERIIRDALIQKSVTPIYQEWINPISHRHALDTMGHNWWGVIVAGAGVIISILDQNHSILTEIQEGIKEWLAYPGNVLLNKKGNFTDGGYIEFLGYLTYALSNCVTWEHIGGLKLPEQLAYELVDFFMVHFRETDSGIRIANFGDSPITFSGTNLHVLLYLAGRFQRKDLLAWCKKMTLLGAFPLNYCLYPDINNGYDMVLAPCRAVYNNSGYSVVRSGYKIDDWFFAMKTGESWNHNHLDAGTFIISAKGKDIVIDSGSCTYSRSEYKDYYVQPHAHNVVLFNNSGSHCDQLYNGTKYEGNFPSKLFCNGFTYLLADCTGPYARLYRRFYRHLFFWDGIILLLDDIHAYADGCLSFLLHYAGDLECTDSCFLISNGGDTTKIFSLFPKETKVSVKTGYSQEIKGPGSEDAPLPESPYLQIDTATEQCRGKFITAFILDYPQNEGLKIETMHKEDVIEILIKKTSSITRIICNEKADGRIMHQNSNFKYDNIDSDAFFIVYEMELNGSLKAVTMINGSRLAIGESFSCGSLLKIDCCFDLENGILTAEASAETRLFRQGSNNPIRLMVGENKICI